MSFSISIILRDASFFVRPIHRSTSYGNEEFTSQMVRIVHNTSVEELNERLKKLPDFQWSCGSRHWNDRTIVHWAAEQDNSAIIKHAVSEGGEGLLELREGFSCETPLGSAIGTRCYQAAQTLIALGADINVVRREIELGSITLIETALELTRVQDVINHRAGYPLAKLLLINGAYVQAQTPIYAKVVRFWQEFCAEQTSVIAKGKEISITLEDVFPPELHILITDYAIDDSEQDAADFIQAKDFEVRRRERIEETFERSLLLALTTIISDYDQGESNRDASLAREQEK